jgi:hypothetical protein
VGRGDAVVLQYTIGPEGAAKGVDVEQDLAAQFLELLNTSAFLEALPAFLPPDQASQQRLPDLLESLRAIAALAEP